MKVSSSKITELWNTREVFFDKQGQRIKSVAFVLFLVLLMATIFSDGYSGRWIECLVDSVALVVIVSLASKLGKERGRA